MGFSNSLRNIRYFFKWLAEFLYTWFTPYHTNEEEEPAQAAEADNAPDRSPKPSPPPEETTDSTYPAEQQIESIPEAAATEPTTAKSGLTHIMAFRGGMTKTAMAAILNENADQVGQEADRLVESALVEDLGDGRYLLTSNERREILRSDPRVADWLSRLQNTQFENQVLDVLDELFCQLAIKTTVGKNLVLHVRQKMWMIWQSHQETCRVRMFSRLTPEQWSQIRRVDDGAKKFRPRGPQHGGDRYSVVLRWRTGADVYAVQSVFIEIGREFQRQVKRRPGRKRQPPTPPPTTETPAQD
jgi:hypothetical protein